MGNPRKKETIHVCTGRSRIPPIFHDSIPSTNNHTSSSNPPPPPPHPPKLLTFTNPAVSHPT
ncbi:hypothetical protein P171DRAFT_434795 [Karstenula rhodostoma CBS 690.94]|uniref:Uncharacterized protein n=1 Tax=Karstenula rhodostoma CBS 690.94 TaxID=1392251 RepID=A0A9P4U9I9_9PLEO|nr:hypothetical protein P171DRAFT_434795 [Karstenula rhodostoma CBS 690.94]